MIDPKSTLRVFELGLAAFLAHGCASPSPQPVSPDPVRRAPPGAPKPVVPPDEVEAAVHISVGPIAAVTPGEHGEIRVVIRLAEGFHIASDHPGRAEYVATRVALGLLQSSDVTVGEPVYPEASPFSVGDETIATFAGTVVVRVPIDVSNDAPGGLRKVPGSVRFQACTSGRCLFPKTLPIQAVIQVKSE